MIALLIAAAMQSSGLGSPTEAADWPCATPLIEKNYKQPIKAEELARRIADECVRPYKSSATDVIGQLDRTTYGYKAATFILEIQEAIQRARRKDAIILKR